MKPIRELLLVSLALALGYGTISMAKQVESNMRKAKVVQADKIDQAEIRERKALPKQRSEK